MCDSVRLRVPQMVDYDGDPDHCYVRFDNPKTGALGRFASVLIGSWLRAASNVMIKLTEMSPPPKLAGMYIKTEVLKGEFPIGFDSCHISVVRALDLT